MASYMRLKRKSIPISITSFLPLALLIPFGIGVWPFASHHWLADIFLLAALPVLDKAFNGHSPSKNEIFTSKTPRRAFSFRGMALAGFHHKGTKGTKGRKGEKRSARPAGHQTR
jgi:hypothetical protein